MTITDTRASTIERNPLPENLNHLLTFSEKRISGMASGIIAVWHQS